MENILPNALCIFNVLGRSVIFPDLGIVALCTRHPMGPGSTLPSGHQGCMFQGCPLCGLSGPFCHGRLTGSVAFS